MEINARSEDGYDRTTLDNKVKETLRQIGSRIEKWEERESGENPDGKRPTE